MAEPAEGLGARLSSSLGLLGCVSGVVAAVAATRDGLPLAAHCPPYLEQETLAAAAAALGRMAAMTAEALGYGECRLSTFDADDYRLLVRPAATGFVVVVARRDTDMEQIAAHLGQAAAAVDEAAKIEAGTSH